MFGTPPSTLFPQRVTYMLFCGFLSFHCALWSVSQLPYILSLFFWKFTFWLKTGSHWRRDLYLFFSKGSYAFSLPLILLGLERRNSLPAPWCHFHITPPPFCLTTFSLEFHVMEFFHLLPRLMAAIRWPHFTHPHSLNILTADSSSCCPVLFQP